MSERLKRCAFCPQEPTRCPVRDTECPADQPTICPKVPTQCSGGMGTPTECPIADTMCPARDTICPNSIPTWCPMSHTVCPREPTVCVSPNNNMTECPDPTQITQCSFEHTRCPQAPTVCPRDATRCPLVQTVCPEVAVATVCPREHTRCPAVATECPVVSMTSCPQEPTQCTGTVPASCHAREGFLTVIGRVKDQFKTDKGKYISPTPIEMKLMQNTDIEQVCVVGMGVPQPIALTVLSVHGKAKSKEDLIKSLSATMDMVNHHLESHEQVEKAIIMKGDWTVENEMVTPSMKLKRNAIEKIHLPNYPAWYAQQGKVIWE